MTVLADNPVTLDGLVNEVLARRDKACRDGARVHPQHVPRASSISDCDREMLLSITHWQLKPAPDPHLLQRFRRGSEIERIVVRELSELGMEVSESQLTCVIKDRDGTVLSTAHIDGKLRWHELSPVFECKSLNPMIWAQINSVEDFQQYQWTRKYPRQLMLYMYATNEPFGVFLLDDCLGHWKVIPMRLEDCLGEVERILQRLRRVVDAKAGNKEIPPIDNPIVCKECWAYKAGVCAPPMDFSGSGIHVIEDSDLLMLLDTHESTREIGERFKDAEGQIKEHFKARGAGSYVVGDYVVTTRQQKNGIRTTWYREGTQEHTD